MQLLGQSNGVPAYQERGPQAYMDEAMSASIFFVPFEFDSAVSILAERGLQFFFWKMPCSRSPVVLPEIDDSIDSSTWTSESACAVLKSVNSDHLTSCAAENSACRMWMIVLFCFPPFWSLTKLRGLMEPPDSRKCYTSC